MCARLLLLPIVVGAALLSGCTQPASQPTTPAPTDNGIAALSADEILAKATAALGNARSFKVKGEMTDKGETTKLDIQFSGKDYKGTVETGTFQLELIRIGDDVYVKAPDELWKASLPAGSEPFLAMLKGKYVKLGATTPGFSEFATLADTSEMLKPEGSVTKGEAKTVNGTPAIGLVDASDGGMLYIATQGEPYPVRIEGKAGEGAIDFSDFNAPAEIKAPSATEVVDLKSITGG